MPATAPPAPLRAPNCPVCGEANQCAPARSGSFDTPCWCTGLTITPEALSSIPADQRGKACLCPRCAEARPA